MAAVPTMEACARSLKDWDEGINQRLEELRAYKEARNRAAPVNARLPSDILSVIFTVFQKLQSSMDNNFGYRWWIPAHVCRYWRELALAQPLFWRQLSLTRGTTVECLEEVLRRAKDTPLIVNVFFDSWDNAGTQLLDKILADLLRIEALAVSTRDDAVINHVLKALGSGDMPLLTTLALLCHSIRPVSFEVTLKNAPRLEAISMCLSHKTLGSFSQLYRSSLRQLHLELSEIPKEEALRSALSGLPHLEVLQIVTKESKSPTGVFAERPISMPRMHMVNFTGTPKTCTFFLNMIVVPAYCGVHIGCLGDIYNHTHYVALGDAIAAKYYKGREGDPLEPITSMITSRAGSYQAVLCQWRESDPVKLWWYGFHRRQLVISTNCPSSLEILCSIFSMFSWVPTLVLGSLQHNLWGNWNYQGPVLAHMRNVEVLTILHNDPDSPKTLLELLKTRISQTAPTMMFSNLRTLYLSGIQFGKQPEKISEGVFGPDWVHNTKPLPYKPKQAILSMDALKVALGKRKKRNTPLFSLVLTSPIGLERKELAKIRGLVLDQVKWDDEVIDLSNDPALESKSSDDAVAATASAEVEQDTDANMSDDSDEDHLDDDDV